MREWRARRCCCRHATRCPAREARAAAAAGRCRAGGRTWKNLASVRTDRQAAPPRSYACAICTRVARCAGSGTARQEGCLWVPAEQAHAGRSDSQVGPRVPRDCPARSGRGPPRAASRQASRSRPGAPLRSLGWVKLALTGSKLGWMTPLLGEAFLTSAMRPGLPVRPAAAWMAPMKSRGAGLALADAISIARGTRSLRPGGAAGAVRTCRRWQVACSPACQRSAPCPLPTRTLPTRAHNAQWSMRLSCRRQSPPRRRPSPPPGNLHRLVPHNLLQDVARLVLLGNV